MRRQLAIVIPAYKATFLSAALDSIAAQTCQNFTLYIGDDFSPYNIGNIVDRYREKINLVYHHFDENLGGCDLVAHWERCIAMSRDEEFIWLFSDDDVMEPNCVEELYKQIDNTKGAYDLYHFDVNEIDEQGTIVARRREYPSLFRAYDYYKGKCSGKYNGYVVENVFSRRVYEQCGGFIKFDLAWGSDVATWCMFAGDKGMCRIPDARVCWRRSSQNITPDKSQLMTERKLIADCALMEWAYIYFNEQNDIYMVNLKMFIVKMQISKQYVNRKFFKECMARFFSIHGHVDDWPMVFIQTFLPCKVAIGLYWIYYLVSYPFR